MIIDLSEPTGHYEVAVFCYETGLYSVDVDRGLGRCTIWQTNNKDKALGVAEYLESANRHTTDKDGSPIENVGEPFIGAIYYEDA